MGAMPAGLRERVGTKSPLGAEAGCSKWLISAVMLRFVMLAPGGSGRFS
jgi:hypothetical protein